MVDNQLVDGVSFVMELEQPHCRQPRISDLANEFNASASGSVPRNAEVAVDDDELKLLLEVLKNNHRYNLLLKKEQRFLLGHLLRSVQLLNKCAELVDLILTKLFLNFNPEPVVSVEWKFNFREDSSTSKEISSSSKI